MELCHVTFSHCAQYLLKCYYDHEIYFSTSFITFSRKIWRRIWATSGIFEAFSLPGSGINTAGAQGTIRDAEN